MNDAYSNSTLSIYKNYLEDHLKNNQNNKRKHTQKINESEILTHINKIHQEYASNSRIKNLNDEESNMNWSQIVLLSWDLLFCNYVKDTDIRLKILETISTICEYQVLKISEANLLLIINKWTKSSDKCSTKERQDFLRCIASFILGNISKLQKDQFSLLSSLFFNESDRCLNDLNENLLCIKYCVTGLTNLCYIPENDSKYNENNDFLGKRYQVCGKFFHYFVEFLEFSLEKLSKLSQISLFRLQHQCLHGLNYICKRPHGVSNEKLIKLLVLLRIFCGFGLFRVVKDTNSESTTTDNEEYSYNTVLIDSNTTDDYNSDKNSTNISSSYNRRPMVKWELKNRKLALELLLKIIEKSNKRIHTEMWTHFMPTSTFGSRRFNLINLLEKEVDFNLRFSILKSIQKFFEYNQKFLTSAQYQLGSSAYLSRSHNLALVIADIHKRLLILIENEQINSNFQLCLITCLTVLINNIQYQKLQTGIITGVIKALRNIFLKSSKNNIELRCKILECFTALVSLKNVENELKPLLVEITGDRCKKVGFLLGNKSGNAYIGQSSWLVQLCVKLTHSSLVTELWSQALSPEYWNEMSDELVKKIINEGDNPSSSSMPIRCQALATVGALLTHHTGVIRPSLETLKKTLMVCLNESLMDNHETNKNSLDAEHHSEFSGQQNALLRGQVLKVFSGFLGTLENKKERRYIGIVQNTENSDTLESDVLVAGNFQTNHLASEKGDSSLPLGYSSSASHSSATVILARDWWSCFLIPILKCVDDPDYSDVRWAGSQCLSLITESVLMDDNLLSSCTPDVQAADWRQIASGKLISLMYDANIGVACQAVWALGYWMAMKPLNASKPFLAGLSDQLLEIVEKDRPNARISVAVNAMWAIGNLGEVLVAQNENLLTNHCPSQDIIDLIDCFNDPIRLTKIMRCLINCTALANQEKFTESTNQIQSLAALARLQENTMRSLALFCRFMTKPDLIQNNEIQDILKEIVKAFCHAFKLPDKAGKVKVKWNSCLCVSQLFRNSFLMVPNSPHAVIDIETIVSGLVHAICSDKYFKVKTNCLISLIIFLQTAHSHSPRVVSSQYLVEAVFVPCLKALLNFTHTDSNNDSVPFTEMHRHCLCLYMLQYILLTLLVSLPSNDLQKYLPHNSPVFYKLSEFIDDHLPLIWQHLKHLNRSFNKSKLLPDTLMMRSPISITQLEVEQLVTKFQQKSTDKSAHCTTDIFHRIHQILCHNKPDEPILEPNLNDVLSLSLYGNNGANDDDEDDGLMTKRPGANFIFNQIYD